MFEASATLILFGSAFFVGLIHTLIGPDHYLPFIAMAKARAWSLRKTIWITTLCGIGHVGSALGLGLLAMVFGMAVTKLQFIENSRGEIAVWILIIFGLLYFIWSLRELFKNKKHAHMHQHANGIVHSHAHKHIAEHAHAHRELTPWILFIIFILGPCEPLIPLIVYPAIKGSGLNIFIVTMLFGAATITAMLFMVIGAIWGMRKLQFNFLNKYGNVVAGAIICSSGLAIKFLGM